MELEIPDQFILGTNQHMKMLLLGKYLSIFRLLNLDRSTIFEEKTSNAKL